LLDEVEKGITLAVLFFFAAYIESNKPIVIVQTAMPFLEALAILESTVLECKKPEVNTPELRAALDSLEGYIYPK